MASEKPRILQDSRDMIMTLVVFAVAMFLTVGFTGLCSFNPGKPENGPVQEKDAAAFLQMEAHRVDFPIVQPKVPQNWTSNSTRAGMVGEHQATIVGYVTAESAFLQLTQTNAPLSEMPDDGKARTKGAIHDVIGVKWQEFSPVDDGVRRVWAADVNGTRMMIEGSAGDAEYRALAEAAEKGEPIRL